MDGVTIERLLTEAKERLAAAGVGEPRREALSLWAAVSHVSPGQVWLDRRHAARTGMAAPFEEALRLRVAGVPAAYASGGAAFRRLDLHVDEHVLIPRPETEGLVQHVLAHFTDRPRPPSSSLSLPPPSPGGERWGVAADIGTGSGCIALSLALEGDFDRVIGTDISEEALEVARRNGGKAEGRKVSMRALPPLDFRHGDLLEPLAGEQLSALVSNPPYVAASEWEALDPGVRDYEPRIALVSGMDGLEHTRRLLEDAREVLRPGGLFAIELDSTRAPESLRLAREHGWTNARVESDLFGRPRYLLATKEPS